MTATPELFKALLEVQKAAPTLPKDKTATVQTKSGGSYQYSYTDLATVVAKVMPLLSEQGLVWASFPAHHEGTPVLRYTLTHASTSQSVGGEMPLLLGGQLDSQGFGSALTYARRYSLCAVLNLVADDDDDGGAASGRQENTPQMSTTLATQAQKGRVRKDFKALKLSEGDKRLALSKVGVEDVNEPDQAIDTLFKHQASALIDLLTNGPIPSAEHQSDIPEPDTREFTHEAADAAGTPLEGM